MNPSVDSIIDAALGVIRFSTVRFESLNRSIFIVHYVAAIGINLDWDTEYISMEIYLISYCSRKDCINFFVRGFWLDGSC